MTAGATATAELATVAHGFTMADLARMAHAAVNIHPARIRSIGRTEAWETAWHEIVVTLYTSTEPPTWGECVGAASKAIARERDEWDHDHGWSRATAGQAPSFLKFWVSVVGQREDFTDGLVERLALPQVLSLLTPKQYEAIVTLSVHRTQRGAADALGLSPCAFGRRLSSARARLENAWLAGETPRNTDRGQADVCRHGHSRDEHGYKTSEGTWACRICRRNDQRRFQARKRR